MRTKQRVSAILTKGDEILLIHRKKEGREYWVVPGGGVEEGETIDQGLIRELKEETGLNLIKSTFIGQNTDNDETEHHYFVCETNEAELVLGGPEAEENNPDNSHELTWVNKDNVYDLSLYPEFLKTLLPKIFA